jgi:DNA-binding response OmpR family regulator
MLVDDAPANLKVLEEILLGAGYKVRSFPSGRLALNAAHTDPPDIILLNVSMPEIDGYEVCARLKADPSLAHIPVLFISTLTEPIDKTRAFGCGGVDYLTKPFHFEEVLARVRTHLNIQQLQQEIERRNSGLEKRVHLRTRQLSEANTRLAVLDEAKTEFLRRIALELRAPLDGLFGIVGQLLAEGGGPPRRPGRVSPNTIRPRNGSSRSARTPSCCPNQKSSTHPPPRNESRSGSSSKSPSPAPAPPSSRSTSPWPPPPRTPDRWMATPGCSPMPSAPCWKSPRDSAPRAKPSA